MELNGLDKFRLITYQNLDIDERNVFALLYQPILGCDAFTLYLTLWSLIERSKHKQNEFQHVILYDTLHTNPKRFIEARQKLEAIGLLVAYRKDEIYLYELKAPLSAEEFIKDGSLGAYLFSRVGKEVFEQLSNMFRVSSNEKEGFENITSSFDKVFDSLPTPIEVDHSYVKKSKAKYQINHIFDFDVFLEGLSKNFVDKRKITKSVREKIMNIAYVYNLDEFTMQKAFMDTVDKDRNININILSKNARKWFEFERETIDPVHELDNTTKQPSYNDMIEKCATETPSSILTMLFASKPAVSELNVVERLRDNFEFSNELLNFLLVYVVGQLEDFPSYNYFDKVAVSWERQGVDTIKKAMTAIKRHGTKDVRKPTKSRNDIPQDIESDWFDEYMKNR